MKPPRSLLRHVWVVALLAAVGLTGLIDGARIQRLRAVSALGADDLRPDANSPTGWAGGKRWLVLPETSGPAFETIALTQRMLARGEWRVRRLDYENAPIGREVHTASPYRWWLAALAAADHAVSGRPPGQSVERAALVADPLLHLLLLLTAGFVAARWQDAGTASVLLLGLAATLPWASSFLPGGATDYGLALLLLCWSGLLLVRDAARGRGSRAIHFLAGAAGGAALWLSVTAAVPILLATAAGAAAATLAGRRGAGTDPSPARRPWRSWGAGGAILCLLGYSLEYLPDHAGWDLRVNHPLFGLAWLGVAELLHLLARTPRGEDRSHRRRTWLVFAATAVAVAAVAVALSRIRDWQFIAGDLSSTRLCGLPGAPIAGSFVAWLIDAPRSGLLFATIVPVLLLVPAGWRLVDRQTAPAIRAAIALALGPALVTLALALHHLRWWNAFDAAVLVLAAATMAGGSRAVRGICAGTVIATAVAGLIQLRPGPALRADRPDLTPAEIRGLYERALAQWITDRAGPEPATVLAPPATTASFCFYGGLCGLGTAGWENRDGLASSYRIAASNRTENTFALLTQAGVGYIVLPSWDPTLETMAGLGGADRAESFVGALRQTAGAVFPWLRPLPYSPPAIAGFDSSVMVFALTDEANPAVVQSRVVEYLVEMHHLTQAAVATRWLQRYPADLGAQVALAQYAKAAGDEDGFAKIFATVASYVKAGADRRLPWDRRVSLAVILALGGEKDLAREQTARCLKLINEQRVRELTTGSLYHLLVLGRHFDLPISDPAVHTLALKLLPAELRERL